MRMVRIDDVAKEAGVSTATVSRALRGLPVVSEDTRARVLEVVDRLGYVASPSASRLAGGRTSSVGVVVPRITRWFHSTVVEAAEEALSRGGYDVLLYNLAGREDLRRQLFHTKWLHQRVDAVMLVATPLQPDDLASLQRNRVVGVTVSSGTPVPGWPCFRIDDRQAAITATRHLIGLGHRRIAHIAGSAVDELAYSTHTDRLAGYQEALRAAGIPLDPAMVVDSPFSTQGGEKAAKQLIGLSELPTAIFAACDEIAMGVIMALRQAGLRVPEDISVVGIDDHDAAGVIGLTTVAQPAAEQGLRAAEVLMNALHQPAAAPMHPVPPLFMPTTLVIRESTAAPRTGRRR